MKATEKREIYARYLPEHLLASVTRTAGLYGGCVNEIRLRKGQRMCVTINGKNVDTGIIPEDEDLKAVFLSLCRHSVYAHTETVKEGFVCAESGLRAGVCGRAVVFDGKISALSEVTSICLRIPHRIPEAAEVTYRLLEKHSFQKNLLLYSPPGTGKTTLLRELIYRIKNRRIAVIDTRHELYTETARSGMIDVLAGYPRAKGIEIALRTLSPEMIFCDEIGNGEDTEAILMSVNAGVPIVATAHAGSYQELFSRKPLRDLLEEGVFPLQVGLLAREGTAYRYEINEDA